mmetsp:Transcript_54675/g.158803  ORF Transcript_54675/g.158803 Transcript_54675/m.158803 type:complete len:214 (+) Transcript_54675:41-682(+)
MTYNFCTARTLDRATAGGCLYNTNAVRTHSWRLCCHKRLAPPYAATSLLGAPRAQRGAPRISQSDNNRHASRPRAPLCRPPPRNDRRTLSRRRCHRAWPEPRGRRSWKYGLRKPYTIERATHGPMCNAYAGGFAAAAALPGAPGPQRSAEAPRAQMCASRIFHDDQKRRGAPPGSGATGGTLRSTASSSSLPSSSLRPARLGPPSLPEFVAKA